MALLIDEHKCEILDVDEELQIVGQKMLVYSTTEGTTSRKKDLNDNLE